MTAVCLPHGAPSVDTCSRCGVFLCARDVQRLDRHVFCEACVARPDVDYLEAHRLRYWGRRDGWAWLFGLGGLANVALGAILLVTGLVDGNVTMGDVIGGGVMVGLGALQGAWFLRQRWARYALPLAILATGLFSLVVAQTWQAFPALVIPLLIVVAAVTNVRSKLFFRLDVPREVLRKDWSLYHDNRVARAAMMLGILGLLVPFLSPLALLLGLVGLRRVDPAALPPVGNKRAAIAGIVTGALGCAWGALLLSGALR